MKDGFGSTPRKLIGTNRKKIEIREVLKKGVMKSYEGTYFNIQSKERLTEPVHFQNRAKQASPLSPRSFNLEIDPLICHLRERFSYVKYKLKMGNEEKSKVTQTYASHILIFAE